MKHNTDTCGSRRELLETTARLLGGFAVATVLAPIVGGCEPSYPPPTAPGGEDPGGGDTGTDGELAFDAALLEAVGAVAATSAKGPDGFRIMLTRTADRQYMALSMRCPHQGCAVRDAVPVGGPIVCPCHNSRFELDGSVVQGPAAEPLRSYPTRYDETTGNVIVTIA